ncbi:MAG: CdaR family protein [Treponema sp.]|nr:CdaR family protein [Treponema sp.]
MSTKGFWARMTANWPAKVLSLAAALLLFFFYRLNRLEDRYISAPLSVIMNDEFVPSSQIPRTVRITLRGDSNSLFKIQDDDLRASLDLSQFHGEGVFRAPVHIEQRDTALGVDPLMIQVEPAEVAVNLERKLTRTVPVTPTFRGFLDPGYELVSFDITPPEVEITGPASAVNRSSDVSTDFIELTGRNSDFDVAVRLVKKDSLISLTGPDTVDFRAVVQKSLAVRTFEGLDIVPTGLADSLSVVSVMPKGIVTVRSSTSDISGFQPAPGVLSLDCSSVRGPGTYTLTVVASVPDGYTLERYEPKTVTVVVENGGAQ